MKAKCQNEGKNLMATDVTKVVSGFRSAIQDLLVPELKAIQVELKHHSEEFKRVDKRFEVLHQEMNQRFEAIDRRFEAIDRRFEAMDKRFEVIAEGLKRVEIVQEMILSKLDIKEEMIATAAQTKELEKRMDDVWSILKSAGLKLQTV
ncbi:MAG: hypothetical protein AB1393_09545 [Candidatus Edwardsbacteria bacterium]